MSEEQDFPSLGEVVVIKVIKVLDYGAFVELPEYDNIKGFIHISQVASGWIKNIRNFIKEGQTRAAKVQNIDTQKNQIDLSLTKVSSSAQRAKINQFKQLKREKKLIENLAKQRKKPFEEAWDEVAEPLIAKYGSLVNGFKQVSINGEKAAEGINKDWVKALVEMVGKSITVPVKTIKGVLNIKVVKSNGVEIIKNALKKASEPNEKDLVDISYLGNGKYLLKASSYDYKVAEKIMDLAKKRITESLIAAGGTVSFERVIEK